MCVLVIVQQWADTSGAPATEWGAETVPGASAGASAGTGTGTGTGVISGQPTQTPAAAPPTGLGDQDWNVGPTTTTKDWGADDTDWSSEPPVSAGIVQWAESNSDVEILSMHRA